MVFPAITQDDSLGFMKVGDPGFYYWAAYECVLLVWELLKEFMPDLTPKQAWSEIKT
jgi:hypothetical protein